MENDLIIEDKRNEIIDITPYLIPETSILLKEFELKSRQKLYLRRVFDPMECWQLDRLYPTLINMPVHQEGDIVLFTHEFLHLYFKYVYDMWVTGIQISSFTKPYCVNSDEPSLIDDNFIIMINNLHHHKMIPYFESFNFPREKIILNYTNPVEVYQSLEQFIKHNINYENPVERYH